MKQFKLVEYNINTHIDACMCMRMCVCTSIDTLGIGLYYNTNMCNICNVYPYVQKHKLYMYMFQISCSDLPNYQHIGSLFD